VEAVSIIRVGLSERKNYAEGYEAIFGNKQKAAEQQETPAKPKAKTKAKAKAGAAKKAKKTKKSS
jgi:hypothetical protein